MEQYVEIMLTILTFCTGAVAIATFSNNRRKDSKMAGEKNGTISADLQYIKSVLLDVRTETKEINRMLEDHSERIARVEESCKQAHKRIDEWVKEGE